MATQTVKISQDQTKQIDTTAVQDTVNNQNITNAEEPTKAENNRSVRLNDSTVSEHIKWHRTVKAKRYKVHIKAAAIREKNYKKHADLIANTLTQYNIKFVEIY